MPVKKADALAKWKADRQSKHAVNPLDQVDLDRGNDDVYDVVEEDEYQKIVESRRQREDFVIDDDGLGYADDGEERLGDEIHDDADRGRTSSKRSSNADLTSKALKKARQQRPTSTTSTGNNKSMWDFVNKASSTVASNPTMTTTTKTATSNAASSRLASVSTSKRQNLDDLLNQLDDPLVLQKKQLKKKQRKQPTMRMHRSSLRDNFSSIRNEAPEGSFHNGAEGNDDYYDGDNNHDIEEHINSRGNENHSPQTAVQSKSTEQTCSAPNSSTKKSVRFDEPESTDGPDEASKDSEEPVSEEPVRRPRRRILKPKSSKAATTNEETKSGAAGTSAADVPSLPSVHIPHATEDTAMIAPEAGVSSMANAGMIDLAEYLEGKEYLDLFWMDLAETRNGDVLVFGKVAQKDTFVSACLLVSGNVRNLFVLPKPDVDMMDVHGEINTLLKSSVLPRSAGSSWAGKPVRRSYAFDDPAIPRTETQYLKVVYDAKYPMPDEEVCSMGGQYFDKILGAGASVTENFIVKRKLMGPCWLRVKNPKPTVGAVYSWCKVEARIDSPKNLQRLDLILSEGEQLPPPPPVVTLALHLKTVVNPKTHKSEIVSIAAICHKQVQLETASDESPKHMTQLTLIRPLAVADDNKIGGAAAQFPRDIDREITSRMPSLRRETNERAMLSRLMAQIGQWDPDVIIGHNAWGFDMEILLTRCIEHKIALWSRIGRRRRSEWPNKTHFTSSRKDLVIAEAVAGRLLCDTYLSAKELLRETTYSLTNLAATQLKTTRHEIEPVDIPRVYYQSSKTIVTLAQATLLDAQLVQKLMFKLQVLPLTKQLTCIAGNIWSHTLKSNRAERTEYLLLHEFHRLKYLPPEKRRKRSGESKETQLSTRGNNNKAKYAGGLVLEPKKGLYDSFILLLDFNSLYPSIIQEYNLCFTTIDWPNKADITEEAENQNQGESLPSLPDPSVNTGVLPRVIKSLVERRRAVKKILKSERNPEKQEELDIRQKALKLTANSMYGCLGFSNSRFYAQPIAALVTAMGRETLQRTVDIAQNTVGLEVIYGDTDSIMINTRINDENDLEKVKELGEKVKKEVNRLYKTLELEIDGIFRSMLLLKKKKYAAKTVEFLPNGQGVKYGQELKGLDLVRRDWCIQSKDTGRYVTEQILSGQDSEVVVQNIYSHLEELAKKMRAGELPLEKYVITKGLNKHPNDYPDANTQPHVQVAKIMLQNNRAVNVGDHIPYVITAPLEEENDQAPLSNKTPSVTERARHPEEILRSGGILKPDIEWYLSQQILQPIRRLCEPIDEVSHQILAQKLGLDASQYKNFSSTADSDAMGEVVLDYTPESFLPDEERFKKVQKLKVFCMECGEESEFPGVFVQKQDETGGHHLVSGMYCPNAGCKFWGQKSHFECYARVINTVSIWARGLMCKYYDGLVRCDEPSCGLETRQVSVAGGTCLNRGCNGKMCVVDSSEREIQTHLKYLECLFNEDRIIQQYVEKGLRRSDINRYLPDKDRETFKELHRVAEKYLQSSAYNWVSPNYWQGLSGSKQSHSFTL